MALTPNVNVSRLRLRAVTQGAPSVDARRLRARTAYNIPAVTLRTERLRVREAYQTPSNVLSSRLRLRVAYHEAIDQPRLRAYGWSLDGHDFYAVNLGGNKGTLVYDITSDTWATYTGDGLPFWRASYSLNWQGVTQKARDAGMTTDVIMGDYDKGLLWTLDPIQGADQSEDSDGLLQSIPCIMQAQTNMRANTKARVSQVFLYGSLYPPYNNPVTVSLSWSDNQGQTFSASSSLVVPSNETYVEFMWRSLGTVQQPGRIFRVSDDGLARIDGADLVSDNEDAFSGQ